ncbi:MAG: STAS domain-containing protein [Lysobacteraceae bacterium]|jgi:anti-anti-sigma factor
MANDLRSERVDGILVITPGGRLDNDSAADFELLTQESVAAGNRHLVIDLSALGYVSNAGLRALGSLAKSLKTPTTSLRVAGLTADIRQVFDAAGITTLFDIRDNLAAALVDHPARTRDNTLGEHAARLLGVTAGNAGIVAVPGAERLAETAFSLLSSVAAGAQQPRAARAMVEGTQVMRKINVAVPAPAAPAARQPAAKKPGFWARLFGRRK